jgi:hypothetical protein
MATLHALYIGAGLLLIGLSAPLTRRKVRPNAWCGFRVRQTLAAPEVWYATGAYVGKYLLAVGVITALTAVGLYRAPGIILAALAVCVACSFRHLAKPTQDSDLPR